MSDRRSTDGDTPLWKADRELTTAGRRVWRSDPSSVRARAPDTAASSDRACRLQLRIQRHKLRGTVIRVEPTRIRQHPDRGRADRLLLQPERRARASERSAVRADAD